MQFDRIFAALLLQHSGCECACMLSRSRVYSGGRMVADGDGPAATEVELVKHDATDSVLQVCELE
jgi:hypothetical protein